jgi:hypothetical protein
MRPLTFAFAESGGAALQPAASGGGRCSFFFLYIIIIIIILLIIRVIKIKFKYLSKKIIYTYIINTGIKIKPTFL